MKSTIIATLNKGEAMSEVFNRIMKKKIESKLSWDEIAHKSGIKMASWMTGLPCGSPKDDEIKKIAKVLGTTYDYLKNGD